MQPSVSIAIPFYNAEQFLEFAILSVINQTYTDWELLLLDDGSTDSSLAIARKYESDKIRVISDGVNRGLVFRLNQSAELSRGRWYARMDADDIMHPDRLKTQTDYMSSHPETDIVGTGCYSIDDKNRIADCYTDLTTDASGRVRSFIHPSIMGRREWFLANKYDANYPRCEDGELWMRTYKHSVFRVIEKPLMFYREYGVFAFSKYVKSVTTSMKILSTPRKYELGYLRSALHIGVCCAKIAVCALCCCTGNSDLMIKLRRKSGRLEYNRAAAEKELQEAVKPLSKR